MSSLISSFVHTAAAGRGHSCAGAGDAPASAWDELAQELDAALHRPYADQDWLEKVLHVRSRARVLAARDMDAALLQALLALSRPSGCNAGALALCRMLVAAEVGRELGYGAALLAQLERAALTLHVPMATLWERLGRVVVALPGEAPGELLQRYALEAVKLALNGGDGDPAWVEAVRQYRAAAPEALPPSLLTPGQHMAVLLRRVECFCLRMARSQDAPATTLQALGCRDAAPGCGRDPIAAALVKAVGLYPPGTLVQLEGGEAGMVLARGRRLDHPLVAVFAQAQPVRARPLRPQLCDTAQPGHAVCALLRAREVPQQPPLNDLLQLRSARGGAGAA